MFNHLRELRCLNKQVKQNLVVSTNKHFACGLGYFFNLMLFILNVSPFCTNAQDTIALQSVEVYTEKNNFSGLGKKSETIDSILLSQFKFNSLADLISSNSSIFIKQYGSGGLATTAFRGGNASQTAIIWNGFNIQNPMLGQTDIGLLPSVLFDNVSIEYGGSSSLWGSGAVAGSIFLNNLMPLKSGFSTKTNIGYTSLNSKNISTALTFGKKKFVSSTKLYLNDSKNNFSYLAELDNSIKQSNFANYSVKGISQDFKLLINSHQQITANAWYHSAFRHLPGFNLEKDARTYQVDNTGRFSLSWIYFRNRLNATIRTAHFNEKIKYTDSIANLFSRNTSKTTIVESDNFWQWSRNNRLNFGASFNSNSATTDNYGETKDLQRFSILLSNKSSFFHRKLNASVGLRGEYFSVGSLPITGHFSAEYIFSHKFRIAVNSAKVYRQPTLNELYWQPGGNINLKAEHGFTHEGSVDYQHTIKNLKLQFNVAAYSRLINNWILWLPGIAGNPTPVNIQKVWSRGTETSSKLSYSNNKFTIGLNILTSYVLSTVESNLQNGSSTLNKQLIYTPRYTITSSLLIAYNNFSVIMFYNYCGYRFTTSDNTEWLQPYHLNHLKLNYSLGKKSSRYSFFAACNNIFNQNYFVIVGRTMPLRNYEIGITLQTF